MVKVARGDRRAFAELFDRHHARVGTFALRFVGDSARAEEVAQDVFVKLFQSAPRYSPAARFKTYLFRIATNHCLNELRRGEHRMSRQAAPPARATSDSKGPQAEEPPENKLPAPADSAPDETLIARELEHVVQRALLALSERERAAFTMARFEGLAYRDIAEALSASEAAVKSLVHRATVAVARAVNALQGAVPEAAGAVRRKA